MNEIIIDPTVKTKHPERDVISAAEFYISFNPATGAGPETALVHRTKEPIFLILEGFYIEELRPLVPDGYDACLAKFKELVEGGAKMSKWSESLL
jgi:hypothetical protein